MLVDCAQTKEKYSTEIINYPLPPACEAAPVGFDYQDVHIWGVGYNVRAAPVDRGDSCCQKCVVKHRVSSPAWSVIFQMYNLGFVYRKICTKTHPCGEKKAQRSYWFPCQFCKRADNWDILKGINYKDDIYIYKNEHKSIYIYFSWCQFIAIPAVGWQTGLSMRAVTERTNHKNIITPV